MARVFELTHAARQGRAAVPRPARPRGAVAAVRVRPPRAVHGSRHRPGQAARQRRLGVGGAGRRRAPATFNGYVTRFAAGAMVGRYYEYRMRVQPWLWFLTRTADCRIFQDKTPPEIIKEVFADHKDGGVRGRAHRHVRQARVLRPVPRDRLRLREPPHGGGGDVLLLRAPGRTATCSRWWTPPPPTRRSRARPTIAFYPAGPAGARSTRSSSTPGSFAQDIQPGEPWHSTTTTSPSRRSELEVKARLVQPHERADYEVLRLARRVPRDGRRRALRRGVASTSSTRSSTAPRPSATCATSRWAASSPSPTPRARDQAREYLIVERRSTSCGTTPTRPPPRRR